MLMYDVTYILYFSQKQMPREMDSRLVIVVCAGHTFWQLFLRRLYEHATRKHRRTP